jgi:hypothetical protein
MLSYVSQLRCKQDVCNIAARAGSLDGRGHAIWAGEKRCFEPNLACGVVVVDVRPDLSDVGKR